MTTYYTHCGSPLGPLRLTANGAALTGLFMADHRRIPEIAEGGISDDTLPLFAETKRQIAAYFAEALTEFVLPLAPSGTAFQQRVWDELICIPYGVTCTYGELARRLGQPNASRAVGLANGRNPISIIIPCHRVIGASGKLTGYSGGIARKKTLLALEQGLAFP